MAIVSYTLETLPKLSKEYLDRVHAIKDEDIDFSDIPRQDLSKYRPWRELHSKESIAAREKLIEDFQKNVQTPRAAAEMPRAAVLCGGEYLGNSGISAKT